MSAAAAVFRRPARLAAAGCALALAALACLPAAAQDAPARKAFRVCQDPNNLPFSSVKGEGYENRIAELFAQDLGLPVEYYSFPQRLAFVRNTLRYKLPGEDYRCDIVMGVPEGFGQVLSTKAYYRSTYALVIPQGRGLDQVRSAQDLLALDAGRRGKLRIGVYDRSPASQWLTKHGLVDNGVPYPMMSPDPDHYPGQIIERDLAEGRLDAAIVWGPIAGYFAHRVKQPALQVVPLQSEPGVRFDYPMAMGVRHGEGEWKRQIEALIDKHRPRIHAILQEYGVPVVEDGVLATTSSR
ncbi:substrate-binding domain-containing protein [Caldimonas tepidiphila]|uniref:substrate-binding domain-containing protein n=1 Tax=Caldimonas tepidiphila TaxID=2315841 RepID=UPI000E5C3773|nr:substrate-binding domain-containing protein [Caldimonas tepidiphila]